LPLLALVPPVAVDFPPELDVPPALGFVPPVAIDELVLEVCPPLELVDVPPAPGLAPPVAIVDPELVPPAD
jgi:hypothetical protein